MAVVVAFKFETFAVGLRPPRACWKIWGVTKKAFRFGRLSLLLCSCDCCLEATTCWSSSKTPFGRGVDWAFEMVVVHMVLLGFLAEDVCLLNLWLFLMNSLADRENEWNNLRERSDLGKTGA